MKSRSFGEKLDREIANLNPNNVLIRAGMDTGATTLKMLARNRVDYAIEYPTDVKKVIEVYMPDLKLNTVGIADASNYILGHVVCPKTDIGATIIKDIDLALMNLYKTQQFYQAHINDIPSTDVANFTTIFKQTLRHQK